MKAKKKEEEEEEERVKKRRVVFLPVFMFVMISEPGKSHVLFLLFSS